MSSRGSLLPAVASLSSQLEASIKQAVTESMIKNVTVLASTKALRTCLSCQRPAPDGGRAVREEAGGFRLPLIDVMWLDCLTYDPLPFCQGAYASANAMFTPKLVRPNWNQDVYRYAGQVTC